LAAERDEPRTARSLFVIWSLVTGERRAE